MAKFKKEWFAPLYYHLRKYVKDPKIRKIMVYGGKSSAKTFSISQLLVILCYIEKCSAIAYRKEQSTIKTTLKKSFKKAIDGLHMESVWTMMDFKIDGNGGNEIVFKGLDKEDKIKGIEGYKYLLLDEVNNFTKDEWEQANFSLRGMEGMKILATWNPVDENSWIKGELDLLGWDEMPLDVDGDSYSSLNETSFVRLSKDGSTLLIKTTYLDNKWVVGGDGYGFKDDNLIRQYMSMKEKNENFYNVNVLGEWGVRDKNKKFAWAFDKDKHVKNFVPGLLKLYGTSYNPNYVVWLSFDFNVNPITCSCIQHYGKTVFMFKCFKLENSNTHALCDHILAYFQKGTIFLVTGDASGANRSTLNSDNLHNYQIIQRKLSVPDSQMYVPTHNPNIESNQVLLNAVLNTYDVWIQPGVTFCDPIIYDLTYVEMDENRRMKKDRSSDKKNADFLDTVRYFFNVAFPNYMKQG